MSADTRNFTTFAWQGIQITIPDDWDLVSTRGDYESGFVSLADDDQVRLQLKWETDKANTDPAEAASRYIREIRKQSDKSDEAITVNRRLNLASLQGKKLECYDWLADNRGTGMVSRCEICSRMIHLVVLGQPDQPLRNLSRTIFASLKDHPEDDWVRWQFYDLHFETPSDIPLKRSNLKTGCIRMQFQKKSEELEIVRTSLAKFLLKDQALQDWLLDFYETELKRHSYSTEKKHFKKHDGVEITGRPWAILDPWRIFGKGKQLHVVSWHCANSNRIFVIGHGTRKRSNIMEDLLRSIECCKK